LVWFYSNTARWKETEIQKVLELIIISNMGQGGKETEIQKVLELLLLKLLRK
jgi:hypothetical protein